MSKAIFQSASIHTWDKKPTATVQLIVDGKCVEIHDMPVSNELIKELTALFKRHLPKSEEV